MNLKVLELLEFEKVKQKMFKYVKTEYSREMIEKLYPFLTIEEVNRNLNETEEALSFINEYGSPNFNGLNDVMLFVEKINKGGFVSIEEIYKIGTTLKCIREMKNYLEQGSVNHLSFYYENIYSFRNLEDLIFKTIKDGEEISDYASEDLFKIRKSIKSRVSTIKKKLPDILKTHSKYLQEDVFTIRSDRYCVPVKKEYKSQVQGIIHNQSSSGATYFIEPLVLVNLNNELSQLYEEEKIEIQRILRMLCMKMSDSLEYIHISIENVYKLEFVFCKAFYAIELEGVKPIVDEEENIILISARHPLLDKEKVVPLNLNFCNDRRAIVITGPNTGGKTVTLKTLGLMHIMGLSGMFIPACDGSKIMFLDEIFADIGDEQSIQASLSTFSSHIKNIVSIIENLKTKNLILLDEVGSGTDPEEGASLAISIIEYFINKKCKIMGTTHYSQLKFYAINSENVENASVEFDINTLKPTYRLNVGIPGKSNAFIISKSLGLNDEILDNANNYLLGDTIKLERIIGILEEKNFEITKNSRDIELLREENKILNEKLKKRLEKIDNEKSRIIEEARKEAEKIIDGARDKVTSTLNKISELELNGIKLEDIRDLEATRREIKKKIDEENRIKEEIRRSKLKSGREKISFEAGTKAFLRKIGQNVVLLTNPDSKGNVKVQADLLKLTINICELEELNTQDIVKTKVRKKDVKLRTSSMSTSIDLRGMDILNATTEVDKYLDDAFVNGLSEVTIIHGKGTGALRSSISELLRRHTHVSSYRLGKYGEGGDGVTVAYIK